MIQNRRDSDKSPEFPNIQTLYKYVIGYVDKNGEWPEDEWYAWSDSWDINIWIRDGNKMFTIYPTALLSKGVLSIDTSRGISVNVSDVQKLFDGVVDKHRKDLV